MAAKKLTARFVETLKTDRDRLEVRDTDVRGLELRVTSAGSKSWALRYRRPGDRLKRTVTLGRFDAEAPRLAVETRPGPHTLLALDDARKLATRLLGEISQGADPAAGVAARRAANTFAEITADWIERHGKPNKSPRALRDDHSMLDRHILPEIGAMKAAEITKRDIIRLLDKVAAKPDARAKPKTKGADAPALRKLTHRPNRVFELVRAIFRWSIGRDLLQVDPTLGVSPPIKKEKPRERDLSPAEIRTLWAALDRAPVSRRYAEGLPRGAKAAGDGIPMTKATALTLKLALATAQRISEVAGMTLAELDLNDTAPVWTIPGDRTKNGQPNRVPLSPLAVQLIAEARELASDSPWLFPSPSGAGPIDPHAPTKALERAREAIGLDNFRIHDLRRTAATRMAEMGISPHTISLVLNHVSARAGTITGKVYVQYSYDREKREALNAWGDRLARIVARTDGANVVALHTAI